MALDPKRKPSCPLATTAHFRFVSIHPFRVGNGRVGRLLMNLLLLGSGYPVAVIPVASRAEYISSLELAQENGDRSALDRLVATAVHAGFRETFEMSLSTAKVAGNTAAEIMVWMNHPGSAD